MSAAQRGGGRGQRLTLSVRVLPARYILHCNPIKSLADSPVGSVRSGLGTMLCPFLSNQGAHPRVHVYKCVWETECVCEGKVCARFGVWWCCDGRHHADFISVITRLSARGAPGPQSRAVVLHTLVFCSECVLLLCVVFLFFCISISETTQLSPAGCTHPPQQTNLTSLQLKEMTWFSHQQTKKLLGKNKQTNVNQNLLKVNVKILNVKWFFYFF